MLVSVRGMRLIVDWMLLLSELKYVRRNSLGLFVVHDVDEEEVERFGRY